MFTGIIENVGTIKNIANKGSNMEIIISSPDLTEKMQIGDSIAVNGVCLTATNITDTLFKVDVSPSTFQVTTLKYLNIQSKVNLELALTLSKPLGGHIVTGHVDGISEILKKEHSENFVKFLFQIPEELKKYIIRKGSIAIDGISLTINELYDNTFEIMIIPHTLSNTTLNSKNVGDIVNIETDIIGKYVENFMRNNYEQGIIKKDITIDFLRKHGF